MFSHIFFKCLSCKHKKQWAQIKIQGSTIKQNNENICCKDDGTLE